MSSQLAVKPDGFYAAQRRLRMQRRRELIESNTQRRRLLGTADAQVGCTAVLLYCSLRPTCGRAGMYRAPL